MFVYLFLLLLMIGTCINLISEMPFYMEIFMKNLHGATFGVCYSRGDREGLLSSEIFVWFETESRCLVWQIQLGN